MTATVGTLTAATFSLTNLSAAPASVTATGGTPQSATVGAAFANPLQATVKDASGNAVSGVTVTFTAPAATGPSAVLSAATAVTNASGVASITATANSKAGTYNVTAAAGGQSASFALTNTAGPAASLTAVTGSTPQSAAVSTAFGAALAVTAQDASGNPVKDLTVVFAAPVSGASATLSGNSAITSASGAASVTATANSTAGNYNVTAIAGTLSATFSLTNTGAAPASMATSGGTPQTTVMGTPFSTPLQVTVKDAANNPIAGVIVTFSVPSTGAGATLSSSTASTNATGAASVSAIANTTAGTYDVTASVGALSAVFALTNAAGQVASVTATGGTPQSTLVSTAFPSPLTVIVKDSAGNPLAGVGVTFAAPSTGASASFPGATVNTNVSGVASVTATANGTAGTYQVTATVGVFSATFSLSNTTAVPATLTATGGTPQTTPTGSPFQSPLQAIVKDSSGAPISGVTVTFTAPSSGATATLSPTAGVTNASGVVSVSAVANSVAGSYAVSAGVGALSATFTLTNSSGQPASVTATGGASQSTTVGTAFAAALQATVKDSAGNPVSGITVNFATPATGAGAVLSSATAVTNSSGIASVTATANATVGSYNVSAGVGALTATFALSNQSGAASGIVANAGTPQSAAVGTAFATALQAKVTDGSGNPVSGVTVTFTAPASGASATLSSATAVSNASGLASVTATANAISGSYVVTATAGSSSTSFSLTNSAAATGTLTATGGVTQSAVMGTAFSSALRVLVKDGTGLPVSGATVTFTAPASGASAILSSTTALTNAAGFASVTATANSAAGSYTVTASLGDLTAQFWLANLSGPAATITSTRGTPQSAMPGAAFAQPLQVTVRDALGNPVAGASVFFTAPAIGAGATVSSTMVSTNALGVASVTATANAVPGSYLVTANVDALAAYFALTNIGASEASNLATGKAASQSSTMPGTPSAAVAVDGISNGNFYGGSVTATNWESSPWWQVDLGGAATVNSLVIFNRTDCCVSRLNDYWIFVSNTPFLAGDTPATLQNRAATYSFHQIGAPSPSATINTGGVQGRYVRVQLSGQECLSLAEVQVMGTGGGTAPSSGNLSQGKTASQSSTLPGYAPAGAASAVDGNTDGAFFDGSVTTTNMEANPWWQVDLGASSAVSSVVVWNRTDCCGSRLGDYWVFISDTPFLDTDTPASLQNRAGTFSSHQLSAPNPSTAVSTTGAQGRYVRIQLAGTGYLSLAEVQAMGTGGTVNPGATNVAQGKTATQSTTLPGLATAAAASAVDGNTDGNLFSGSVTATDLENSPWWQVDLGASKTVSSVTIWNRTDCCGSRLNDYWVFVSDTPFLATDTPATLQGRAATFSSHQTTAPAPSAPITVGAPGRYVRVQLTGQNYLSLAEVQVLGQ